ncbi:MAG: right-handed parallel beta-helix repeat-containing protein [Bacteroidales bacterium]|nr:right-handed parallel beta-helix repeat-containing protein [Bacteroidales bacterium]
MKNIKKSLVFVSFIFPLIIFSQTIIPGGDVSGIWTNQSSPYLIEGEITIPEELQLTIEPGVLVEFQGHYKFKVGGILLALGNLNDTIIFTINDTTGFHNMNIPDGGWHGLRFSNFDNPDTSFLSYCKFEYGKAVGEGYGDKYGGAIYSNANHIVISQCRFQNNSATYSGGAIKIYSNNFEINNCHITNNTGGGINIIGSYNGSIYNCLIANNQGIGISGDGFYAKIINNAISDNHGCGIYFSCTFGSLVVNNTICNNISNFDAGGINISFNYDEMYFYNNIIYGNSSEEGNQIYIENVNQNHFYFYNNNIEGGKEEIPGNSYIAEYVNNIDIDPFFNLATPNDYSLQAISSCINAGSPDTTGLNLPTYDIEGNPRFYNNSFIDMGAYEFQGEPTALPEIGFIQSSIEFGFITKNEKSIEHPLRIFNYGHAPLEVNITTPQLFSVKPEGDSIFVQELFNLIIPPKKDTIIHIIFIPTDTLYQVDSLQILSNDQNDPIKYIALSGTGIDGVILEGVISDDSTICTDRIFINDDVSIEAGAKLTICAGTEVEFLGNYNFNISGLLHVNGELEDSVTFKIYNDSLFPNNPSPNYWGGLLLTNNGSTDSSKLLFCIVKDVYNQENGVIYINNYSQLIINRCHLRNNNTFYSSEYITPGITCNSSSPLLTNNILKNNGGTGIYCLNNSNPYIINNSIKNNSSYGIYTDHSAPLIKNNIIENNGSKGIFEIESHSSIISNSISYNSPGISLYNSTTTRIFNNVITHNSGLYGGGISIQNSHPLVYNNTITQNISGHGGGIKISNSHAILKNNNIVYNTATNGNQISISGTYCNPKFYYNNIEGGFDSITFGPNVTYNGIYENNIDTIPQFINTGEHPYMLQASSPCIDIGTPDTNGMYIPAIDFAGNPRIYNDRIDIGAYEYGLYPPYFTSEPIVSATVNEEYTYEISASDLTANPLTFDYNILPDWLTLNSSDTNSAQLTGTPQTENIGENQVEITVSNSLFEVSQSFFITIPEVGTEEYAEELFKISPNPSKGLFYLHISKDLNLPYRIEILSCTGKTLRAYEVNQKEFFIDVTDLVKGLYFIKIIADNKTELKKLIIQ